MTVRNKRTPKFEVQDIAEQRRRAKTGLFRIVALSLIAAIGMTVLPASPASAGEGRGPCDISVNRPYVSGSGPGRPAKVYASADIECSSEFGPVEMAGMSMSMQTWVNGRWTTIENELYWDDFGYVGQDEKRRQYMSVSYPGHRTTYRLCVWDYLMTDKAGRFDGPILSFKKCGSSKAIG